MIALSFADLTSDMMSGTMPHELILLILLILAGFYMAWSIGANDVANAMGTSVGSGALTLRQAVLIAAVLEFSGAFFFGSHVAETVQKGIINPDIFAGDPMTFVLGMLASLIGVGVWLQVATYFGWPVSTTHSMVGAIVGFGAIVGGIEAIYWENVGFIVTSWVLSPLFGALFGFSVFLLLRKHVLYRSHPLQAAKKVMPYLVFGVIIILCLLLLFNGLENSPLKFNLLEAVAISVFMGSLGALITIFAVRKVQIPTVPKNEQIYAPEIFLALEKAKRQLSMIQVPGTTLGASDMNSQVSSILSEIDAMKENLSHPEEYESSSLEFKAIEKMFGYLQILSACLMAFAHGANDVANAIGPLSAAILVLKKGTLAVTAEVPTWALALGGVGIVVGLATWGWRVIETIGKKLTELTPTRGFAAEFAAALTILVASRLGMPISTTHTLVGAVVGVGLARGLEALNLATMRDIILSWFVTVPAGAIITVGIFWILNAALN